MIIGQWVSFGMGGADKASYLLIKGLIELGIEVKIFYNDMSIPYIGEMSRYDQCRSLGAPMFKVDNLMDLNKHGLNILNTHRSGEDLWLIPGFEKANFNFKVVETNFHGQSMTKADFRVFPSYTVINNKNINYPYTIIPNPIMHKLSNNDLKSEFGLNNKFVFGRLATAGKNIYSNTCLRSFKLIENDDIHFLYVAPCDQTILDVNELQIKNITFIDRTLDEDYISKLYNTFDVFCHSNCAGETFGNTLAEAMTHGKPIVSHLGAGNWPQAQKEVIGDYGNRYVCENDEIKYSELMLKLLTDKQEYDRYSAYIKDRAITLYDYKVVAKKYIDVYKSL